MVLIYPSPLSHGFLYPFLHFKNPRLSELEGATDAFQSCPTIKQMERWRHKDVKLTDPTSYGSLVAELGLKLSTSWCLAPSFQSYIILPDHLPGSHKPISPFLGALYLISPTNTVWVQREKKGQGTVWTQGRGTTFSLGKWLWSGRTSQMRC